MCSGPLSLPEPLPFFLLNECLNFRIDLGSQEVAKMVEFPYPQNANFLSL